MELESRKLALRLMRRLIYVSRSTVYFSQAMLDELVAASTMRNEADSLTGMLWYDGFHFAQVLEGEADAVERTIQRIFADSRHSDFTIFLDKEAVSRAFGRWGMTEPQDCVESAESTGLLVGLAMSQRGVEAERLRKIIVASEARHSIR